MLLGYTVRTIKLFPTGLSPSLGRYSTPEIRVHSQVPRRDHTPHLHGVTTGIQFALFRFRSPLLTESQLISFLAGTRMFRFPAFPFLCRNGRFPYGSRSGSPIRLSRVLRLLAPTPGISQLGTTFIGARAEPSPKRRTRSRFGFW